MSLSPSSHFKVTLDEERHDETDYDFKRPVMNAGNMGSPRVLLHINLFLASEASDYCVFFAGKSHPSLL